MRKSPLLFLLLVAITVVIGHASAVAQIDTPPDKIDWANVPDCAEKTLDQYLGKSCKWALWAFFFEKYSGTATGNAPKITARDITVSPTFYPNGDEFYGLILTAPWSVDRGQSQTSDFVIWFTPLPGKVPYYFLNGMDFVGTTGNASITARYTASDAQGNSIPGTNAFLYANAFGRVLQQGYTQIFPAGTLYPVVMDLNVSLRGNQGTANAKKFDFSVSN